MAAKVALKLLRPELAAILGGERFLKEIRLTANLQHPHILSFLFVSPRRSVATGAPQVVWVDNWFKDLANRRTR